MPDAVDEDEFRRDYHLVVFHVWNGDGGDGSIGDNRLTGHHPVRVQPDIEIEAGDFRLPAQRGSSGGVLRHLGGSKFFPE